MTTQKKQMDKKHVETSQVTESNESGKRECESKHKLKVIFSSTAIITKELQYRLIKLAKLGTESYIIILQPK